MYTCKHNQSNEAQNYEFWDIWGKVHFHGEKRVKIFEWTYNMLKLAVGKGAVSTKGALGWELEQFYKNQF